MALRVNQVQKVNKTTACLRFRYSKFCFRTIGEPGRSIAGPPGIDGYPGQPGGAGAKGE